MGDGGEIGEITAKEVLDKINSGFFDYGFFAGGTANWPRTEKMMAGEEEEWGVIPVSSQSLPFYHNGREVRLLQLQEESTEIEYNGEKYVINNGYIPDDYNISLILLPTSVLSAFVDEWQIPIKTDGSIQLIEIHDRGLLCEGYDSDGLAWFTLINYTHYLPINEDTEYFYFLKEIHNSSCNGIALGVFSKTTQDASVAIGNLATACSYGVAIGECAVSYPSSIAIGGMALGASSIVIGANTSKSDAIVIGPMEIDRTTETLAIKNIDSDNIRRLEEKVAKLTTSSSSGLTVTTYPFPSQRNVEVQENAFTIIWQNITVPAHSEVYARVTVNLNASPAEGQRIALGFVAEGLNVAASAAPLPVVSGVEHSMCLQHWFEEETTLSVAVHSTITAYVTNIVSPLDAKMNGGTELIIKTFG